MPLTSEEPVPDHLSLEVELRLEGMVLDESNVAHSPMLPYVRMLVSLIEGVEFSRQEIIALLLKAMRQHSMARRRRAGGLRSGFSASAAAVGSRP